MFFVILIFFFELLNFVQCIQPLFSAKIANGPEVELFPDDDKKTWMDFLKMRRDVKNSSNRKFHLLNSGDAINFVFNVEKGCDSISIYFFDLNKDPNFLFFLRKSFYPEFSDHHFFRNSSVLNVINFGDIGKGFNRTVYASLYTLKPNFSFVSYWNCISRVNPKIMAQVSPGSPLLEKTQNIIPK